MSYIVSIFLGYLMGCIQGSYILGKIILKKDIRDFGNGNAGASNATVVFGKRFGFYTVLIDGFKAVISIAIIRSIFRDSLTQEVLMNLAYLNGFFVIIGHNFPFYMAFKGGKGTAALVGLLFAIDYRLGLASVLLVIIVVLITDYIVIGTFSLLIMFIAYTLFYHFNIVNIVLVLIISSMSIYKHYKNILAIKAGTETKVLSALKKKRLDNKEANKKG